MFFPEIALYALDVYYNQTYGSSTAGSKADTVDNSSGANAYNNLYSSTSQKYSIYGDYPPYYDYFHGTYRKFTGNMLVLQKLIETYGNFVITCITVITVITCISRNYKKLFF